MRPAETSRSTSVEIEKLTTSAGSPAATALLCTSEAANEVVNLTPLPAAVAWYAEMSFGKTDVGIEYATSESVVSLLRPVWPAAVEDAASAARTVTRASERRIRRSQPFSIELVEFGRLMTAISMCQALTGRMRPRLRGLGSCICLLGCVAVTSESGGRGGSYREASAGPSACRCSRTAPCAPRAWRRG